MLFDLSLAQRPVWHREALVMVFVFLHEQGVWVFHYMHNILILTLSKVVLLNHSDKKPLTLVEFSWTVNIEKSQLTPFQSLEYLGTIFDMLWFKCFFHQRKSDQNCSQANEVMSSTSM